MNYKTIVSLFAVISSPAPSSDKMNCKMWNDKPTDFVRYSNRSFQTKTFPYNLEKKILFFKKNFKEIFHTYACIASQ